MLKKTIAVAVSIAALLGATAPILAWSGCRYYQSPPRPDYAFAKIVCYNPEEPVEARAVARSSDGSARATAISIIITDGEANITNTATAISRTGNR